MNNMTEEQLSNAAYAAQKRREHRRRKILINQEDRLKKIMGYDEVVTDDSPANKDTLQYSELNRHSHRHSSPPDVTDFTSPDHEWTRGVHGEIHTSAFTDPSQTGRGPMYPINSSSVWGPENGPVDQTQEASTKNISQTREERLSEERAAATREQHRSFQRVRYLICLLMGIVVRLSFLYSIGEQYVQSIFNPYVAFEIAVVGYQRAMGMDLGAGVRGGMWLSLLVLIGVDQRLIDTYKSIMGTLTAAADDFTLYFFAFIVLHLFL